MPSKFQATSERQRRCRGLRKSEGTPTGGKRIINEGSAYGRGGRHIFFPREHKSKIRDSSHSLHKRTMKTGPETTAKLYRSGAARSTRSQAARVNLFVLIRILFQYLDRVDQTALQLAKEVSSCPLSPSLLSTPCFYHLITTCLLRSVRRSKIASGSTIRMSPSMKPSPTRYATECDMPWAMIIGGRRGDSRGLCWMSKRSTS